MAQLKTGTTIGGRDVVQELDSHKAAAAPHSGHETPSGAQAKVDAHNQDTQVHGATPSVIINSIMARDANGRAKVAPPSASDDIARKAEVDIVQAELDAHLADDAPNLRGNQIYHVEVISSSVSETPDAGRIIFDTSQGKFFGGNGTEWV